MSKIMEKSINFSETYAPEPALLRDNDIVFQVKRLALQKMLQCTHASLSRHNRKIK